MLMHNNPRQMAARAGVNFAVKFQVCGAYHTIIAHTANISR